MKILGIETVTKIGSLAVVEQGEILGQTTIDMHLNHASNLINALDDLLDSLEITLTDIDAIAIDTGPGSFTGIRVGIASAMGIAQPDNKLMTDVCSLEVLAYQAKEFVNHKIFVPVIDAKRGVVYSAFYSFEGNKIRTIKKPCVSKIEDIFKNAKDDLFVFGPEIRRFKEALPVKKGIIVDTHNTYPSAGTVARISEFKANKNSAKKRLEPMYIHDIL